MLLLYNMCRAGYQYYGLCPGAPRPTGPPSGISCAPSAFNFSSVWFRWYSITLRFLKYVTQLDAQFASNPLASAPHTFAALSPSLILSIIWFLSKHLKYASLASQHCFRCVRSGAIGAPSEEILGAGSFPREPKISERPILGVWIWIWMAV